MSCGQSGRPERAVALLAEGVDRNTFMGVPITEDSASPSSRRAWIEIAIHCPASGTILVALLAEGVDRNSFFLGRFEVEVVSPSSRRAWIEI